MSYISEQLLNTPLIMKPTDLGNDIDHIIEDKLKLKIEGRCHENGFIVKDSVAIINRKMGKIVTNNRKSEINYHVTYKAKIISPSEGDELNIYINNINKMGVIGYIKIKDSDTSDDSPLVVMVPKEYFDGSSRNLNDLTIGQQIDVEVLGHRIKYRAKNIQIIAKPL